MRSGPLTVLLLRLGLAGALYTLLRVLFVQCNPGFFDELPLQAYLGGLRFDAFAIAWLSLPWFLSVLVQPRPSGWLAPAQELLFLVPHTLAMAFNTADIGYYPFTLKRSTADLFGIMEGGGDLAGLLPVFVRDYWWLLVAFLLASVALVGGYRIIGRLDRGAALPLPWRFGWRVLALMVMVLASRGGAQLVPLQPVDAATYGGPGAMPVVLNTPYTLLTSLGKPAVTERRYMEQWEADVWMPLVKTYSPPALGDTLPGRPDVREAPAKPNVVVIVLESFSAAYSGRLSGGESYMPFLDSLMGHGIAFTRAYANGRRSIDGLPAIIAGLPHLMDEAFVTSRYASLSFTSLASVLAPEGWSTSFYHGGRNGTMAFDGFTRSAGFARYVGMNEYTGPAEDFDGHWGIRDRPWLRFWADELAREPQPFLSVVFTLSSHHPYALPAEEAARFAGGTQAIQPTLRYADDALRRFFATARTMPWYANTLFVITADHTADLERRGVVGGNPADYWVPLLYYAPWLDAAMHDRVTQHIDILPTVLDLIGHERPFFAFGGSALRAGHAGVAIWSVNGIHYITGRHLHLAFDGEKVIEVRPLDGYDALPESARAAMRDELEMRLKAAVQQFNNSLLRGVLAVRNEP